MSVRWVTQTIRFAAVRQIQDALTRQRATTHRRAPPATYRLLASEAHVTTTHGHQWPPEYERTQTEREIINQVNSTYNQLVNTNRILSQQSSVAENYERLLAAEILNLENGESDLFKINIQQEKLIQSQSKLLKLKAEYEKMKATLYWAAGVRNLNFQQN